MEQLVFPVTKKAAEKQGGVYSSDANKNALFPSRLRELRKEKGVSQDQLANELGVSKSTIGLYETGDTLPDAKTLHDLGIYFGVSVDWILGITSVRSLNANMQNAVKFTGLSENALQWVSGINRHITISEDLSKQLLNELSLLIENDDFPHLLVGLSNLRILASQKEKNEVKELSEEWIKMLLHVDMAEKVLREYANGVYSVVPNTVIIDSIKFSLSKTFNKMVDGMFSE